MKNRAKELIEQYVERFDYHINDYKSGNYNESQARTDFINPFFEALGWDINNKAGLAESYREVIYEDKIKVAGSTKAPDYCFTVYGQKKFFVEAKKPKVNIKDQIEPAYQLRRYGWSAKLPISLITDFEEFAVYDCLSKPNPTDKASVGRIKYINYKDYIKEFDFIWDVFSKEQILKGSFDRFVSSSKGKKGTAGVDAEFLKSLDTWRDLIARNIVNRNANITEDELNFATQKLIDRLIFLRICEDRGVELENQLMGCVGKDSFQSLKQIFHIADQKYNSGLFDYKKDKITDTLSIDDKVLKDIIEDMYYPKSPYEFSVIPVEIMGHSYEQYLGKVMRITPGHRIKIEEKPEVRKAGGVYYTPEYIVNYIVENTVGKFIDGKTPEEVSKIKVCDPACGSGSFLLGAYQYLLNWHKNYYSETKIKNKDKYITPEGNLTTSVKKQILLNNIFGVDIDTNAVEVTKLSLMLKAMEGETTASINQQLSLMHDKVLPTLDDNIKSGNSLIDLDFYENELDFEPGMEKKIKPFNWQSAFPQVFKQGGFDAVIGNPPYVDSEEMVKTNLILRNYCNTKYKTSKGNWDLYCVFIEKSIDIMKISGMFGFITPNKFLSAPYGEHLRRYLSEFRIDTLADFSSIHVFKSNNKNINVYPVVTIVEKVLLSDIGKYEKYTQDSSINLAYQKNIQIKLNDIKWTQQFDKEENLLNTIFSKSKCIDDYFVVENSATVSEAYLVKEFIHEEINNISNSFIFINSGTIDRYSIKWGISKTQYIKDSYTYPLISKDLLKKELPKRYLLASKEKLVLAGMIKELEAIYDNGMIYSAKSTTIIMNKSDNYSLKYLLALLNSKLYSFVYTSLNKHNTMSGGYMNVGKNQLSKFIFFSISFDNEIQAKSYLKIIELVEAMLQLNKDLQTATLPEHKEQLQARISYTDKKIDQLVYQLYELTEEEIKIVEGE